MGRMGVDGEPLLQPGHLSHGVDEGAVPLAAFLGGPAAPQPTRERRHLRVRDGSQEVS